MSGFTMPEIDWTAVAEAVGKAFADGAEVYLPALKRLALEEVAALWKNLQEKKYDAAYALVSAKMTVEELAAEKEALAALATLRATKRAEDLAAANAVGLAILKAALSVLLAGVLL